MILIYLLVRRVKCDEAKPSCHACVSTGRKCDGYAPTAEAPPDPPVAFLVPLSQSLSIEFHGTPIDRRSFYFFQQKTAPQLSRFFGDEVWERLILQAAHHDSSIRHAILSLGSLHVKFEQDSGLTMQSHSSGWTDKFALEHYGHAINMLVRSLSQQDRPAIDVCLICCILFACIEVSSSS
jgi:hypothetical protein